MSVAVAVRAEKLARNVGAPPSKEDLENAVGRLREEGWSDGKIPKIFITAFAKQHGEKIRKRAERALKEYDILEE